MSAISRLRLSAGAARTSSRVASRGGAGASLEDLREAVVHLPRDPLALGEIAACRSFPLWRSR
jgi:hypothetical protein